MTTSIINPSVQASARPIFSIVLDGGTATQTIIQITSPSTTVNYQSDVALQAMVEAWATSLAATHTVQLVKTAEVSEVIQTKYAILDDTSGTMENHSSYTPGASQTIVKEITSFANVTVNVTLSDAPASSMTLGVGYTGAIGSVSPSSLTFTSGNYSTPQAITVTFSGSPTVGEIVGMLYLDDNANLYVGDTITFVYV